MPSQQQAPQFGTGMPMPGMPSLGQGAVQSHGEKATVQALRLELQRAEQATKNIAAGSGAFVGLVARISRMAGEGTIECAELLQQYSTREVQIAREQLGDLVVGDAVVFKVVVGPKGAPVAGFVRRIGELTKQRQRILEIEAPLPAAGSTESPQEYLGFITSFQADPGYGFISCAQTRQLFGGEVYIHRDQCNGINVGDAVNFRVAMSSKGMPVARSVRTALGTAEASGMSGMGARPLPPAAVAAREQPRAASAQAPQSKKGRQKRSRSRSGSASMSMSGSPARKERRRK